MEPHLNHAFVEEITRDRLKFMSCHSLPRPQSFSDYLDELGIQNIL